MKNALQSLAANFGRISLAFVLATLTVGGMPTAARASDFLGASDFAGMREEGEDFNNSAALGDDELDKLRGGAFHFGTMTINFSYFAQITKIDIAKKMQEIKTMSFDGKSIQVTNSIKPITPPTPPTNVQEAAEAAETVENVTNVVENTSSTVQTVSDVQQIADIQEIPDVQDLPDTQDIADIQDLPEIPAPVPTTDPATLAQATEQMAVIPNADNTGGSATLPMQLPENLNAVLMLQNQDPNVIINAVQTVNIVTQNALVSAAMANRNFAADYFRANRF